MAANKETRKVFVRSLSPRDNLSEYQMSSAQTTPCWSDVREWLYFSMNQLPALIINLDRRRDRWRRCQRMCQRAEVLPMRIAAVDGQSLLGFGLDIIPQSEVCTHWDSSFNAQFDTKCVVNKSTPMTLSERACSASHIRAWRIVEDLSISLRCGSSDGRVQGLRGSVDDEMLERHRSVRRSLYQMTRQRGGWSSRVLSESDSRRSSSAGVESLRRDAFLILEDDAGFLSDTGEVPIRCRISDVVHHLPDDFDICYLGYVLPRGTLSGHKKKVCFKSGFLQPTYLWQLHAYLLTGVGAQILLKNLPVDCPVDNFVAKLIYDGKLKAYAVKEQMVRQVVQSNGHKKGQHVIDSNIIHSG
eukprot:CAMPEP_0182430326 /NCGR_PEP_ID=MMETSP1167-20130531/39451_1 /TAXON_ID=2988 /ORGANISM="Mallomonas Sp, Strain CCMP3275" /LENGTH=356 /DNA_ID=CAMNT_0024615287 /DNA_START=64 /DNA_END=1130 /DNA_ORIENTATION=+